VWAHSTSGTEVQPGKWQDLSHLNICIKADEEPETGSLKIYKDIEPDDSSVDLEQFWVHVVGPGHDDYHQFDEYGEIQIDGLQIGESYAVTEHNTPAGWVMSGGGSVEVTAGEPPASITVTNTRQDPELGSLKVKKIIDGDDLGKTVEDFQVRVTWVDDPDDPDWSAEYSFPSSGELVVPNLDPGQYEVEEINVPDGFTVAYSETDGVVTVVEGQEGYIEVTNTGELGSLRITKEIKGDNPDNLKYKDFYVAVTGGPAGHEVDWYGHFDNNGVIVLEDLWAGKYTIKEKDPNYPFTVEVEPSGLVDVEYAKETGVTIINTGNTTTTEAVVTTENVTTSKKSTGTTQSVETSVPTTKKPPRATGTTALAFTSDTVEGWVMEPDAIQTGGGGMAGGGGSGALIVLVLASTLLGSVLVASAVGVRAGIL